MVIIFKQQKAEINYEYSVNGNIVDNHIFNGKPLYFIVRYDSEKLLAAFSWHTSSFPLVIIVHIKFPKPLFQKAFRTLLFQSFLFQSKVSHTHAVHEYAPE